MLQEKLVPLRGVQPIIKINQTSLPQEGFEPSRPNGHWPLKPACLPIPALRLKDYKMFLFLLGLFSCC